ncbi:MAG: hypothetical protein J2P30_26840 [Actinobacteria bacterium]|nr:hypothetical protein [Actinomycetota bacterium]
MPARKHAAARPPLGIAPMTNELEGEENGVPYGLLMWGQAGIFNAVDDRMVISAVSDSAVGVVRPARMSAGPGLSVQVSAGWLAIASCDDGTHAVVGSRQTHTLTETAGPATGAARRDHVWIETNPDGARWEMKLIPEGDTIGRPGVSVGVITVPAGANLASQFTFSQWVPTLGRHSDAGMINTTGTGMVRLTAAYPIAPYQLEAHNTFRVRTWGDGQMGSVIRTLVFRANLSSSPIVRINPIGQLGARDWFCWECEAQYQVTPDGTAMRSTLRTVVTRWQSGNAQQGETTSAGTVAAARSAFGVPITPQWYEIFVQAGWGAVSTGQRMSSFGSTYDTFQHYFFH